MIIRIDPLAVVLHKKDRQPLPIGTQHPDRNARLRLVAHELHRVVDEILHHFHQPRIIAIHDGQILGNFNLDAPRHDPPLDQFHRLPRQRLKRNFLRRVGQAAHARQAQQSSSRRCMRVVASAIRPMSACRRSKLPDTASFSRKPRKPRMVMSGLFRSCETV